MSTRACIVPLAFVIGCSAPVPTETEAAQPLTVQVPNFVTKPQLRLPPALDGIAKLDRLGPLVTESIDEAAPDTPPAPSTRAGHPTCADVYEGAILGFELTTFDDGTYTSADGFLTVAIDFHGNYVNYNATGQLLGVIVRGSAHANVYSTLSLNVSSLSAPDGEDMSAVTFCYVRPG